MARRTAPQASFDDQLVLFRYFLHELKIDSISALSEKLNGSEYEGVNESGNTYFYTYIAPYLPDARRCCHAGKTAPV